MMRVTQAMFEMAGTSDLPYGTMSIIQQLESESWFRRARTAFWILTLLAGGVLTYTTRYYLNGDGLNYLEMGSALSQGNWRCLVNLTESPGYPFFLGLGHLILHTDRLNEVPLLKLVNFVLLLLAAVTCDVFVVKLRSHVRVLGLGKTTPLPFGAIAAVCYGLFLYLSLAWVRIQLVAPDMIVLALVLAIMTVILWIREDSRSYLKFVTLGFLLGLAYLSKSFFFPFSAILLALAAYASDSLRKSWPRVLVAGATMLCVASPQIVSLSQKAGRFSYGDVGTFGFVKLIGGQGDPIHKAERLLRKPTVLLYREGPGETYPEGFDLAYWTLGMRPKFKPGKQLRLLLRNIGKLVWFAPWLTLLTLLCFIVHALIGWNTFERLRPSALFPILMAPAVSGLGLYSLIHVEPRYLVSFIFLGVVAFWILFRFDLSELRTRLLALGSVVLMVSALLFNTVGTTIDQSRRGLASGGHKPSYRNVFEQNLAVSDFLKERGLSHGAEVAMVGRSPTVPLLWARMANVRVVAVVPDQRQYLHSTSAERAAATDALTAQGVRVAVSKGSAFGELGGEGWQLVPGTTDYFARFMPGS